MTFLRKFSQFSRLPRGVYLSVLCSAIYGLTMVVTKGALETIPPLTLLTVQTASSVTFLWVAALVCGTTIPWRWNSLKLGLNGLLEPGLSYIFGMLGLALTTASNATFISTTEPVITLFLAWLILRERVRLVVVGLCALACAGVALVAAPDAAATGQGSFGQGSFWGDLLIALAVLFASFYAITTPHAVKQLAPVAVAAIQQSVALLFFLVVTVAAWALRIEGIEWTGATGFSLLVAVASGAFGYGLAFLLYLSAARHLTPSRISLYLTLTPVFGVIGAYLLLGETLLLTQGFGGLLILAAAVGISQLPPQNELPQGPRQV